MKKYILLIMVLLSVVSYSGTIGIRPYVLVQFDKGVYGDENASTPVTVDDFEVIINQSGQAEKSCV